MELNINTLIEFKDIELKTIGIERVLWISPDLKNVVLINIDKGKPNFPKVRQFSELMDDLSSLFAIKLSADPYKEWNSPESDYLIKHKKIRDEKWNIIKDYVDNEPYIYDPNNFKETVSNIKKKTGLRSKRIYSIFREYWLGGKTINSLLPNYKNSGGRGKFKKLKDKKIGRPSRIYKVTGKSGVNVTEEDKKVFEIAIKPYLNGKIRIIKEVYDEMIPTYYISGYKNNNGLKIPIPLPDDEIPTYRQFLYWYNTTFNPKEKIINKLGERKYNLSHRPILGNSTNKAQGPGDIFEIDATIADIYLVSELDRRRIIGRPVIYIVKDVFTRMVVGVYVGLEGPSWLAAMLAIENTTMDKMEYCKKFDIEIDDEVWPSHHLPKRIKADRGEFESGNADNLVESLGIQVINAPPYRADLKGIVERHFRIINDKIKQKWMPGAVHKDFLERGGRDYRLDAKLTLKSFEKIIVLSILEHNQSVINGYPLGREMMEINLLPTPINLWNWGRKHKSGLLREVDRDLIRLNLMPTSQASVTGEGIIFNKMRYSNQYFIEKGWFEKGRIKRWKEKVYYDPRSIQHIYLKIEGQEFIKCYLVEKDERYTQFRLEEILEQHRNLEIQKDLEKTTQRQISIDINTKIDEVINQEVKTTNEKNINEKESSASKLKNIKDNRKNEKEFIRNNEDWKDTLEQGNVEHNGKVIDLKDYQDEEDFDDDYLFRLINDQEVKEDS